MFLWVSMILCNYLPVVRLKLIHVSKTGLGVKKINYCYRNWNHYIIFVWSALLWIHIDTYNWLQQIKLSIIHSVRQNTPTCQPDYISVENMLIINKKGSDICLISLVTKHLSL